MSVKWQTVFETSSLSNGTLGFSLLFLGIGVFVVAVIIRGRFGKHPVTGFRRTFMIFWALIWNTISVIWVFNNLITAYHCHQVLRDGTCQVLEGIVEVLHEQPSAGHDSGDRIRIGGREFEVNYYYSTLGYNRTISHGGQLKNGVYARLHIDGPMILKVEIGRQTPSAAE